MHALWNIGLVTSVVLKENKKVNADCGIRSINAEYSIMMNITSVEEFTRLAEETSHQKPVLFDFYADWCGPCKVLSPVIDAVADEMGDQAVVAKVDADEFFELADRLGIRGLPALVIYRQGGVAYHLAGLRSKEQIMELLK